MVSEDKIYEEKEVIKSIPIADVSEAGRHLPWIREHERRVCTSADIYTVFITNSQSIEKDVNIYAGEIYYLHRDEFVQWANKALTNEYRINNGEWNTYTDEGDMAWRESAHQTFLREGITPKDYMELVCRKKLKELPQG